MMYYRRKVILSLLQAFDKSLKNTVFQKYLFLFTRMQENPSFDFIPYKYGCFSFQAIYDKEALIRTNHLSNDQNFWTLRSQEDFIAQLITKDKRNLTMLKTKFGHYSLNKLLKYVYTNYPYYAINSEIAEKYLTTEILNKKRPTNTNTQVFTIGYEGSTIENYLNRLIKNNIQIVVDVRNNPNSMKSGFSKKQLSKMLEKLHIEYIHMPDLGIPSDLRKKYLSCNRQDYKTLFLIYEDKILNKNQRDINKIKEILEQQKRIALTCFENVHIFCHRSIVADRLEKQPIHI